MKQCRWTPGPSRTTTRTPGLGKRLLVRTKYWLANHRSRSNSLAKSNWLERLQRNRSPIFLLGSRKHTLHENKIPAVSFSYRCADVCNKCICPAPSRSSGGTVEGAMDHFTARTRTRPCRAAFQESDR